MPWVVGAARAVPCLGSTAGGLPRPAGAARRYADCLGRVC